MWFLRGRWGKRKKESRRTGRKKKEGLGNLALKILCPEKKNSFHYSRKGKKKKKKKEASANALPFLKKLLRSKKESFEIKGKERTVCTVQGRPRTGKFKTLRQGGGGERRDPARGKGKKKKALPDQHRRKGGKKPHKEGRKDGEHTLLWGRGKYSFSTPNVKRTIRGTKRKKRKGSDYFPREKKEGKGLDVSPCQGGKEFWSGRRGEGGREALNLRAKKGKGPMPEGGEGERRSVFPLREKKPLSPRTRSGKL